MPLELVLLQAAEKQIRKLDKSIQRAVLARLKFIQENPEHSSSHPMTGAFHGYWTTPVLANWRIVYSVNKNEKKIIVALVGPRKDVYGKGHRN